MDILKNTKLQLALYFLLPPALSLAGVLRHSWLWFLLMAAAIFLMTAILPICSGRESVWVFLVGLIACTPPNLMLLRRLSRSILADIMAETWFDGVLWFALVWLVMISLESLLFALLSRLLWRDQDDDEYLMERLGKTGR